MTPPSAHPLNMTSGPVQVSEAVLEAQLHPFLTPHHADFWALHDETLAMLGRLLATRGRVLVFHGSIRAGLDVALANLVRPGAEVLAISNGYWGDLIGAYAAHYGARVRWVREESLAPVRPDAVSRALEAHPEIELVTLVHVETNTGLRNPVAEIGALVERHGALYYVDTACSAGGMPLETDAWHVDVGITGSHKCLCSVPGLAVVSLSERAFERAGEVSRAGNYFDFHTLHAQTIARAEVPPFTQPSGLFRALNVALAELEAIGQPAWFERHRAASSRFRSAVRDCGLSMLPEDGVGHNLDGALSDTVMAVRLPAATDLERFRRELLEGFGIYVLGNLGEFAGCSFRVGLMSPPQLADENLSALLEAIPSALEQARGHQIPEVRSMPTPIAEGPLANDLAPLAERSAEQRALVERAQRLFPGGTTCAVVPPEGLEFIIERGVGPYVYDVDGRRFLDFLLGGGPLLLGHANPRLMSTIAEQTALGTHHMGLTRRAVELVERYVRYVPCAEMARFTSSGSEATFHALRLARAATGRRGIIKFDGAYHGHHDLAAWSFEHSPTQSPTPFRETAGAQRGVEEDVVVLPFNDADAVRETLLAAPERFAALICEPMQRAIPPRPGFLEAVREACDRTSTVLIFDEVVTGFRLAPGGAQERFGVVPDLATFGKALSGGLPFSALLGKRELMSYLEPGSDPAHYSFHCGTYNGYALGVACSHTMLDVLIEEGGIGRLAELGALAREKVEQVFVDAGIAVQVSGEGPVFQPYFIDRPVHDHRAVRASDLAFSDALHRKMYEAGIYKYFSKTYIGLAHDESHIAELTGVMRWAVRELGAGRKRA